MNRREFLKQAGAVAAGAVALQSPRILNALPADGAGDDVYLVHDPADAIATAAPAQWAVQNLVESLAARRIVAHTARNLADVPSAARSILVSASGSPLARGILDRLNIQAHGQAESLALAPATSDGRPILLAAGHDVRGLVYALTEVADAVAFAVTPADALRPAKPVVERPANAIRSAMRMIASDVEDKSWFHDRDFWPRYLSMLVTQRFNRFNFSLGLGYDFPRQVKDAYFYFAYPFLLSIPGYDVRVPQLPAAERDRNLEMLRFASDEAARRGLEFQLGIWTHAYQWPDSPGVNYTVDGVTPDNHANYCRDAVRALLKECPNITGVTFRVHGESGVAEGSYGFWKTLFEGVASCGRTVGIDMHAKGMDQPMIDLAVATGLPITISPKYWAEHMGLPYHQAWIRPTEMPRPTRAAQGGQGFFSRSSGSRSFLRYGYGDLMREDRKYNVLFRIWPGTQRLLLWGDPVFAAAYGRASSFCGASGIELFEPLSFKGRKGSGIAGPRDAFIRADGSGNHDFDDYLYTYRLWGRLTYNPDAQPDVWHRQLRSDAGGADWRGYQIETLLASASRILPLITTAHLPSAANNSYWPEIYTNMSIVDSRRPGPYGDTPSPKRFGTVSPLDPQLFSRIDDHADELLKGEPTGKYSPAEVAQWLFGLADAAIKVGPESRPAGNARHWRTGGDIAIQAGIGRFFAHKLRAGLLYAIFDRTHDAAALNAALAEYRAARDAWSAFASGPASQFAPDITFGLEKQLRGHWKDRLPAIDQDIAAMQAKMPTATPPTESPASAAGAIAAILTPPPRPKLHIEHQPPASFVPGRELALAITLAATDSIAAARLFCRHVDQSEPWQEQAMDGGGSNQFKASIPASYTDSPYPLQYYFDIQAPNASCALFPGLNATFSNQPYFVVRMAR